MALRSIAACCLVCANSALADVVVFDNRAGLFLWNPFHSAGVYNYVGNYFDPTSSPQDNPFAGPTSLHAEASWSVTSDTCLPDSFIAGVIGGSASIVVA